MPKNPIQLLGFVIAGIFAAEYLINKTPAGAFVK